MADKKKSPDKLTPMERQYNEIKARHKDKILLFRLGDFYEMFDEDAKKAANILHIALTSRHGTPMCGFPYHAANPYILKLIKAGQKVAICEQLEDPSKAKGIVKRDIINIVTPGTLVDESFITQPENNYLCAIYSSQKELAISMVDISTGEFFVIFADLSDRYRALQDELARFSPSEIIFNQKLSEDRTAMLQMERTGVLFQSFPDWYFEENQTQEDIIKNLKISDEIINNKTIYRCITGAFNYLSETQFRSINNIKSIELLNRNEFMEIDDFTLKNLELIKNMQDGAKKFTLLDVLDNTITSMGARLLRRWIVMPLIDLKQIYARQNFTQAFFDDTILISKTREILKRVSDIDRLTTRIALKKALPKGLTAISASLKASIQLKKSLINLDNLSELAEQIEELDLAIELIDRSIMDEPSNSFGGNVIKPGYNEELDRLRDLMKEGKNWIVKLQNRERQRTGINSLKVKYNKVFGYFIEVSKTNLSSVPDDYIRKQSLVNAERYTLPELSEYEVKITSASEKTLRLEEEIFNSIVDTIGENVPSLQKIASKIAEIDVYSNYAQIAKENRFVKPMVDNDDEFIIHNGRHPVVEKYMGFNLFVSNDTVLDNDENRILIITGPNMAGKSTYLRQNALIAVMSQIGSYVPAQSAKIGVIDKIFTRIGASDQLSAGRSTFLVEMEEAANILKNSTSHSLIIMDELGRGTSTYDGLSIAWAVIEYLHEHPDMGGKTLFATHYHELTKLGEKKGVKNFNIAVKEYNDELIFIRKVVEGPADKSYGIYVAKLAGINNEIIERAGIILDNLESEGNRAKVKIERTFDKDYRKIKTSTELQLFPDSNNDNIIEKIKNIDVTRITPIEAITFLAEVKKDIDKSD